MSQQKYKSLVTKEITDHYLSIIKDENIKKGKVNFNLIFIDGLFI
jgi:hypothetical protein